MRKVIIGIFISLFFVIEISAQTNENNATQKLNMAFYVVNNFYVDKVNSDKMADNAIIGMLRELDPHSNYMTPKEVIEMNEPLQGNFDGIGIQFNVLNDTLFVIQTISGGPSEKVGVVAGDRIVAVNDTAIAGVKMSNSDIMKRLRGPKGSTVAVSVLRKGATKPIVFKIVRDKIPIYSMDAAFMADNNTGYIRINRFAETTHKEFLTALKDLESKGMKNLILDLQGNGGGYLNAAVDMVNELLDKDRLIVYTEGRKYPRKNELSNKNGIFKTGRVVILVDETTASASEIVSGAIQDWDRGLIVGRRTFGKGLVQRPIPLPDGSMIRLTVSRYYTPSGRSIQKPYKDGIDKYNTDLINRYNRGELTNADSIHFPDSLRYKTMLNKRTVYGGGGIMPDYFIPLDTSKYTNYHRDIVASGTLNKFVITYVDQNRTMLKETYKDFNSFNKSFTVSDQMLNELVKMADVEKIKLNEEQLNKSKPLMMLQIKALIARDLFDLSAYFKIINENNDSYKKALLLINDTKEYNHLLNPKKN